jgi:hypothetical protein
VPPAFALGQRTLNFKLHVKRFLIILRYLIYFTYPISEPPFLVLQKLAGRDRLKLDQEFLHQW